LPKIAFVGHASANPTRLGEGLYVRNERVRTVKSSLPTMPRIATRPLTMMMRHNTPSICECANTIATRNVDLLSSKLLKNGAHTRHFLLTPSVYKDKAGMRRTVRKETN